MTREKDPTVGITEIAHQLGRSTRTIRRWHADGKIASFQIGGPTSPIKMTRVNLRKLQNKRSER